MNVSGKWISSENSNENGGLLMFENQKFAPIRSEREQIIGRRAQSDKKMMWKKKLTFLLRKSPGSATYLDQP